MSPPVRPVPFWKPTGIDGSATSESPWELLLNVFPQPDGWHSFGGWRRCSVGKAISQRLLGAGVFFDGHSDALLRLGLDETARLFILEVTDSDGNVRMHVYTNAGYEPVEGITRYSMAALNGRVFFSADGRTPYVSAVQGTDTDILTTNIGGDENGGLIFAMTEFRDGVNSANWGYINGNFGAPVVCAHSNSVFYGGFTSRVVSFPNALTDDQRIIDPSLVETSTSLRLNAQCICYTDADDPFAIGLRNFIQLKTKYPITAMVSWKDSLIVLTTGDVWKITGEDNINFDTERISEGVGCQHSYSACATPHGVIFGDRNGLHICTGDSVQTLSATIDFMFQEMTPIPDSFSGRNLVPFQLDKNWGGFGYIGSREEVWCPVAEAGSASKKYILVYSFRTGTWTVLDSLASSTTPAMTNDYVETIVPLGDRIFAVSGSNIYEAIPNSGAEIASFGYMVTKPLLIDEQAEQTVIGSNFVFRDTPANGTLHLWGGETWADGDEQFGEYTIPAAPEFLTDEAMVWGTGKWGANKWTGDKTRTSRMDFLGRSGYWRIGMTAGSAKRWHLRGMELLVRPNPVKR